VWDLAVHRQLCVCVCVCVASYMIANVAETDGNRERGRERVLDTAEAVG